MCGIKRMKAKVRACELCGEEANLYCDSDAAFLCFACDATVHGANFLVARHLRHPICRSCNCLAGEPFSGHHTPPSLLRRPTCRSCSPETNDSISCSSSLSSSPSSTLSSPSSACVSSTETTSSRPDRREGNIPARFSGGREERTRDLRSVMEEGIFVNWCKKLGLNSNLIPPKAAHAKALCLGQDRDRPLPSSLPFRVALAASFWYGVRSCGGATWRNLRGLQELSGVPGKLIAAVELKLENAMRLRTGRRRRSTSSRVVMDLEEGWAEC